MRKNKLAEEDRKILKEYRRKDKDKSESDDDPYTTVQLSQIVMPIAAACGGSGLPSCP